MRYYISKNLELIFMLTVNKGADLASAKSQNLPLSDEGYSEGNRAAKVIKFLTTKQRKDVVFYDRESENYSKKRYPEFPSSYTQFFFKRRMDFVVRILGEFLAASDRRTSVLEVGCADGIVLRNLYDKYEQKLEKVAGIDTSEGMIRQAVCLNGKRRISYQVRNEEYTGEIFGAIFEVGVLNYTDWRRDLLAADRRLVPDGIFICSLAGARSLFVRMQGEPGYFGPLCVYQDYERELRKRFTVISEYSCGYYIPLIWKWPRVAIYIQLLAEAAFSTVFPGLAHEKVYVLKKKSS